jgi:hypothetical protein
MYLENCMERAPVLFDSQTWENDLGPQFTPLLR